MNAITTCDITQKITSVLPPAIIKRRCTLSAGYLPVKKGNEIMPFHIPKDEYNPYRHR